MTAYLSTELTPPVYPVSGVGLGGRTYHAARGEFTSSVALALNDTVAMFDLPPRARVVGGWLKATDIDSNGSPTIALSLGISGTAGLFFSSSTVGQAGGVDVTMAATGRDYLTTGKTRVILTVATGPATGVAVGTIVAHLAYHVEEPL
jgi:hypothetical protein